MLALAAFFLLGAVLGGMVVARGAAAMGGELRRYLEGYLALRIEGAPSSAAVWQTMVGFFRASAAVFLLGFASVGVALIPAVLLLVQAVAALIGVSIDLGEIGDKLLQVVNAIFTVLAILGIVTDPTTTGTGDSERALTYTQPWTDSDGIQ